MTHSAERLLQEGRGRKCAAEKLRLSESAAAAVVAGERSPLPLARLVVLRAVVAGERIPLPLARSVVMTAIVAGERSPLPRASLPVVLVAGDRNPRPLRWEEVTISSAVAR
jgi:hypothetical protein